MNPRTSLMGFFLALLLLPASARAEDAKLKWKPIQTASQVYYIHLEDAADAANYKRMQKIATEKPPFGGPLPLWVDKTVKGKTTKVLSKAALGRTVKKPHTWHINLNKDDGGNYSVKVDPEPKTPPAPLAKAVVDAAAKQPADVPDSIWNVVVNSKVPPAQWPQAAAVLKTMSEENPDSFAKLAASGKAKYDEILDAISVDLTEKKAPEDIVKRASELADGIEAPAARPKRAAPPPAVAGKPVAPERKPGEPGDVDPVSTLTALLKSDEAVRTDFAGRLAAYLLKQDGEKSFIAAEGHQATAEAEMRGAIDVWVSSSTKDDAGCGKSAILYYVLGETAKPWFVTNPSLASLSRSAQFREDFLTSMLIYTVGGSKVAGAVNAGPYNGSNKEWFASVLNDAVKKAADAYNHSKVLNKDVKAGIGDRDPGLNPPGGTDLAGKDLSGVMANSFDAKDLYEKGAMVALLPIPGEEGKFRKISIKIMTKRVGYGPPAEMVNEIGIFDISEPGNARTPSNIFGQRFPLKQSGESVFRLDDSKPDSISYKLTMGPDGITFGAADGISKKSIGEPMKTSIEKLYELRTQQAKSEGSLVKTNGQTFRVIGQGGAKGTLLYYDTDSAGRAVGDSPAMISEVNEIGAGGYSQVLRDKRPLGFIGMKEDGTTPQFYYLKWNEKTKYFEPVKGEPPKEEPKKPAGGGGVAGGKPDTSKVPAGGGGTGGGEVAEGAGDGEGEGDGGGGGVGGEDSGLKPLDPVSTSLSACKYTPNGKTRADREYGLRAASGEVRNRIYQSGPPPGGQGWTMFTEMAQTEAPNSTYLCVNTMQVIFFAGVIGNQAGEISAEGNKYLVVKIVKPSADPTTGAGFIKPGDLTKLFVNGDHMSYKENGKTLDYRGIDTGSIYYIPIEGNGLKEKITKAGNVGIADKLAWVRKQRSFPENKPGTGSSADFAVFLHDGENFLERLKTAVVEHAKNTLCTKKEGNGYVVDPTLATYLKKLTDDSRCGAAVKADLDPKSKSQEATNVHFLCKSPEETRGGGEILVATPAWGDENLILRYKENKLVLPAFAAK